MAMKKLSQGDLLPNGATVLKVRGNKLLAVRKSSIEPFVTWEFNDNKDCYWGHYFNDLDEALADLHERAKKLEYPL